MSSNPKTARERVPFVLTGICLQIAIHYNVPAIDMLKELVKSV